MMFALVRAINHYEITEQQQSTYKDIETSIYEKNRQLKLKLTKLIDSYKLN